MLTATLAVHAKQAEQKILSDTVSHERMQYSMKGGSCCHSHHTIGNRQNRTFRMSHM